MNVEQRIEQVAQALLGSGVHFGHGTDNARDEAAWLVLSAIGARIDGNFRHWERELLETEEDRVRQLLQARVTDRLPMAYLTGTTIFAGLEFETGRAALGYFSR